MKNIRQLNRRDFLKTGGVFTLGISLYGCGSKSTPFEVNPAPPVPWTPDVYVSFDADGVVHIISHRSEMGQGIRTGLPAVLADEMEADWKQVVVDQAIVTSRNPDDLPAFIDKIVEEIREGRHERTLSPAE